MLYPIQSPFFSLLVTDSEGIDAAGRRHVRAILSGATPRRDRQRKGVESCSVGEARWRSFGAPGSERPLLNGRWRRRREDESTRLTLAHACQRAIGLTQRPPLDQFLAQKDEILAGEEFPDENKYDTD
jgi:hypothetical protein